MCWLGLRFHHQSLSKGYKVGTLVRNAVHIYDTIEVIYYKIDKLRYVNPWFSIPRKFKIEDKKLVTPLLLSENIF